MFSALARLAAVTTAVGCSFVEHNPHGVDVHTVHLVQSAHLDIGCKTFGCSAQLAPGEPDLCLEAHVEPFAYHIVNRWLDDFMLQGVANANNRSGGAGAPYRNMVQPWIVSVLLDCERAGLLSWPGSGWAADRRAPLLHCPNASTLAQVRGALVRGDLFFHAFPHNAEPAAFPDASLFDAALALPQALAAELGIAAPTAVSQRDVPGWTRAALPLLARRGINGLSFGAGQPPGMPDVPPLFVWRDEASGAEVVVTYESGYGVASNKTASLLSSSSPAAAAMAAVAAMAEGEGGGLGGSKTAVVFVLPSGEAMAAGWSGDNTGPTPNDVAQRDFAALRALYPRAAVKASTFDAFFDAANAPAVKAQLPVVTAEIGDGWVYGVPSDPLKNAMLRETARQRSACVGAGVCDPASAAMRAFDRLLVKVPEHTWGVASQIFMPDYANWTNAQFDAARAVALPAGFRNGTSGAEYNLTTESWNEQRLYVTDAPKALAAEQPALAAALEAAFEELQHPAPPSTAGLTPVPGDITAATFVCGGRRVGFDDRGALTTLASIGGGGGGGTAWASATQPVGLYRYTTFDNEDYNLFLQDFASRVSGPGCGGYGPGHADDSNCKNFRKPNVTSARPRRRTLAPSGAKLWSSSSSGGSSGNEGGGDEGESSCAFVVEVAMDADAHALAGAPERLVIGVNVTASRVSWDVVQVNKRPTRLPEAGFFSFNPAAAAAAPGHWRLQVLGSRGIDPTDVVGSGPGGGASNASVYGGSPHLRGVEALTWAPPSSEDQAAGAAGGINITSLDVPVVCVGEMTPFPSPRTEAPDMAQGVHFNIFQNIWNTNYVLWYPFLPADRTIRSRFELAFI